MNLVAVLELVPTALIGSLVWWLAGKNDTVALLTAGTILVLADLVLRWRARAKLGAPLLWLYSASAGGVLFVFPVWTLGTVQLGVAVARSLGVAV